MSKNVCVYIIHTHIHKYAVSYKKRIRDSKWIPERMYCNITRNAEEVFIYYCYDQNMVKIYPKNYRKTKNYDLYIHVIFHST